MTMDPLDRLIEKNLAGGGGTGTPTVSGTPKPADRTSRQAVIRAMTNTQLQVALRMNLVSAEEVTQVFGPNKIAELTIDPWGSSENQLLNQWSTTPPEIPAVPTATPTPATPLPTGAIAGTIAGQLASGQQPDLSALTPPAPQPGYGANPASAYTAIGGQKIGSGAGSSGGSGGSAPAAPKLPPPPVRDSAADLRNRGALQFGGATVLDGQQYRSLGTPDPSQLRPGEQFSDRWPDFMAGPDGNPGVLFKGTWYPLPPGSQEDSTAATQLLAQLRGPLQNLGPAVTTNSSAMLGRAALQGPARPRISAGSGMDSAVSLDQLLQSTYAKGPQTGDFLGSAQTDYGPVDIARGAIPDYGGMRGVDDSTGDATGYTGRIGTPNSEIGIGTGAINQVGTHYGTQLQSVLAPYLSQAQINKIDPAKYDQIMLAVNALRDQNGIQQADTAATKGYQAANYTALTGDPYELDMLPETYARGGSMNVREPSVIQGLLSGKPYGVMGAGAGERVSNITPLGNERQQRMAGQHEQAIAQALGGRNPFGPGRWEGTPQPGIPPAEPPPQLVERFEYRHGQLMPNGQVMIDIRPRNGVPDWIDQGVAYNSMRPQENKQRTPYVDDNANQPAAPLPPTPNVYAQGGQVNTMQPPMSPMQNPMVLDLMARGIRSRARKVLPSGLI